MAKKTYREKKAYTITAFDEIGKPFVNYQSATSPSRAIEKFEKQYKDMVCSKIEVELFGKDEHMTM